MLIPREIDGNTNKLCQTSNRFVCNLRSKRRLVAPLVFQRKKCGEDVPQTNFGRDARIIFLKYFIEVSRGDGKRRVCSLGTRPVLDFIA